MSVTALSENLALHQELIEYATASFRLLFIQDATVFTDFQSSNEFNDLTTMELSEIVVNNILPKINSYQLTETVKRRLRILKLHPGFRRTPQGYQYRPQHLQSQFVLKPKCDFNLTEQLPELLATQEKHRNDRHFRPNEPKESHTLLVDYFDAVTPTGTPKFQLSLDIASLLSAMLSTDQELSSAQLHNQQEIQRRLRRAKQSFEDNGRMLPYRNNLESLSNYIHSFERLTTNLCKTLASI